LVSQADHEVFVCEVVLGHLQHPFTSDLPKDTYSRATKLMRICGGSVAEWLECWTQAHKGMGSNRSCNAVG